MSRPKLLDASCVLAWAYEEAGADVVDAVITQAFITAPNMAEVVSKLQRAGGSGYEFAEDLVAAGLTVVPLAWPHVRVITEIQNSAAPFMGKRKLSLGDLCCLAFGVVEGLEILTADRAWALLPLRTKVQVIRS